MLVVSVIGFLWRLQMPLNWGIDLLIVFAFSLALLFSGVNALIGFEPDRLVMGDLRRRYCTCPNQYRGYIAPVADELLAIEIWLGSTFRLCHS